MARRLIRRVIFGLGLVLAVVTATFFLINLAPGDPARLWVGPGAGPDELAAARHLLNLDQPLPVRYLSWLMNFAWGNWGFSIAQQRPVAQIILGAVPNTLLLAGLSLFLTYAGGIAVGLLQATRNNTALDTGLTVGGLFIYGMPSYWLAIMLVLIFSYGAARMGLPPWLQFPAMGVSSINADLLPPGVRFIDRMRHLTLPLVTLSVIGVAGTARFVRGAVLDVKSERFLTTARAKGLRPLEVQVRHLLRNALLPLITLLGLSLPALFSGTVFVEVIFAWPGMGREIVTAVGARDYPVVMATTAVFAVLVVAGNLLADVLYGFADPRIQREQL